MHWAASIFIVSYLALLGAISHAAPLLVDTDTERAISLYQQGDVSRAISILALKASEGIPMAQYNLAVAHALEPDSPLSRKESEFWLQRAADSGYPQAQFNLAMTNYAEQDKSGDLDTAIYWLTQAAAGGNVQAQYNLAHVAFSDPGAGVTRVAGLEWLAQATKRGDGKALKLFDLLERNQLSDAPQMYPVNMVMDSVGIRQIYAINRGQTKLFAFPVARQKPIQLLDQGTIVEIMEEQNDWLGVRLENGFPAWVAREELVINGTSAIVRGLEASLYVEPVIDREVFKFGVVISGEVLEVREQLDDWVQVNTPDYFVAWVHKARVAEVFKPVTTGETPSGGVETVQVNVGEVSTRELDSWYSVYSDHTLDSKVLGIVTAGTMVSIEQENNGFSKVRWQGGIEAWISGRFLDVEGSSGRVSGDNIRVRILPDTSRSATVVGTLGRNQVVAITGVQHDWYRIVIDKSATGWVRNL